MKFQKQKFHHRPDEGVFGDCLRTCYAILLGVDAEAVPHFMGSGAFDASSYDDWMDEHNLRLIRIVFPAEASMEGVMMAANAAGAGMPYMLSGWSRTPSNHVVVCQGIEIVCDPSLTDSGIVGPMQYEGKEEWWVEWLVRPL